ncbi:MAG: hypothetical protein J6U77_07120 [Verrucomicrobia bacterium]|nr:hypothetical protein [Verrucomicrobiota bacterium]
MNCKLLLTALCSSILACNFCAIAQDNSANLTNFNEAVTIIQKKLVGANKIQFDKKALQGLADQLSPSVQIITNKENAAKKTDSFSDLNLTNKVQVLDKYYLRLCPGKIESESQTPFQQWNECIKTNEIRGIILDLRNVSNGNYSAAADFVSAFLKNDSISNLFSLGNVTYAINKELSHTESQLTQQPLSILINSKTAGPAEAIAAALDKEHPNSILIGEATAGQTVSFEDFSLSDGTILRIATDTIHFSDGTLINIEGITPEIKITTSEENALKYFEDPFTNLRTTAPENKKGTSTNKVSIKINEAELVKMQNSSNRSNSKISKKEEEKTEEEVATIYDPCLARAVDVLKTFHWIKQTRKN